MSNNLKPSVIEFEDFVNAQTDLGITWRGEYLGRYSHNGFAVDVDNMWEAGVLLERLKTQTWFGLHLGQWSHQDQMGYGFIVSWNRNNFSVVRSEEVA